MISPFSIFSLSLTLYFINVTIFYILLYSQIFSGKHFNWRGGVIMRVFFLPNRFFFRLLLFFFNFQNIVRHFVKFCHICAWLERPFAVPASKFNGKEGTRQFLKKASVFTVFLTAKCSIFLVSLIYVEEMPLVPFLQMLGVEHYNRPSFEESIANFLRRIWCSHVVISVRFASPYTSNSKSINHHYLVIFYLQN